MKKILSILVVAWLVSLASAACVYLDSDVHTDPDIYYDCMSTTNISYSMDYPSNSSILSHHANILVNASVYSTNQIINTTLYLWNGSGTLDRSVINVTTENGTKTFGTHTLASSTWSYGFLIWDNASSMLTVNNTFYTRDHTPYITMGPPSNTSTHESPVTFTCTVGNSTDGLANTTLLVYNASGIYNTTISTTTGDGVKTFTDINLINGNYNWTCFTCDIDNDCGYAPNGNYTLSIVTLSPSPSDDYGDCVTERGYSFSMLAGSEDYILFNLTDLDRYLRNADMENIWVEGPDAYKYSNRHMVLDTRINKSIIMWIGDYNHNDSHTALTPDIDSVVTLDMRNFTRQNNAYWITLRNESDGSMASTTTAGTFTLDIYCDNYAPERWDLKNTISNTTFLVTTREDPMFHAIWGGDFNRIYETPDDTENITLFFLNTSTHDTYNIDFTLEDYTGDYSDSYLKIIRKVNQSLETIWQKQWYNQEVLDVSLENNTFYQYVLYKNNINRIIDWDRITSGDDKTIVISQPILNEKLGSCPTLTAGWTWDYDTSQVGAVVSDDTYDISSYFNVSNASGSPYIHTYSAASEEDDTTYSYTLPDKGIPVFLELTIDHPECGTQYFTNLILLVNDSYPVGGAFTPTLPDTVLGAASQTIKSLIALGLTALLFLVFCKASDFGTGALIGTGAFAFFWHVNLLPKNNIPLWFIAILLLISFSAKMFERRT